jgi:alkylation response protein AidB-like acyl-CoA dehydrogenase
MFTACDYGAKQPGMCVVIVPLNCDGVSRGKPLDKMGQRALPQGEVFFDNVTISREWMLVAPEDYDIGFEAQLSGANSGMGLMFTGVARAAFELALDYAHERKQGGMPIIEHQDVQRRLFDMFRKVEMCRALSQRVNEYGARAPRPSLLAAAASKVSVTDMAVEVATEALQMFGGNGLTCEYPIEKIFRDARAAQIEDGCNHVLRIKGGSLLNKDNPLA